VSGGENRSRKSRKARRLIQQESVGEAVDVVASLCSVEVAEFDAMHTISNALVYGVVHNCATLSCPITSTCRPYYSGSVLGFRCHSDMMALSVAHLSANRS